MPLKEEIALQPSPCFFEADKYTNQLHEDLFDVLLHPVDYLAERSLIIFKMHLHCSAYKSFQ